MYRWDMEEVKKEIKRYKRLKELSKDSFEQSEIQGTIYSFQELQDYYRIMTQTTGGKRSNKYYTIQSSVDLDDLIYSDLEILREYGLYCPIVRDFTEAFDWEAIKREDELPRIQDTTGTIVAKATKFYQHIGGFFFDTYRQLEEHFNSRLMFSTLDENLVCSGFTHPIYRTDHVYIDVGRNRTFQDFVSFIHEASHGITSLANQDIMYDAPKYCFLEVDSLFFELVGTDYVGKELDSEEEALSLKRATFIDYLYNADLLCSKMDMYSMIDEEDITRKVMRSYFSKEVGYDKTATIDACSTFMRDYMNYIVSYLTAIELYLIYTVDQQYALDLLQKIVLLRNLSTKEYLDRIKELGIIPGKNIQTYYNMISPKGGMRYVKKV